VIDLYHTIALCPYADLLNHSSSAAHTSLSADDFVCHRCGSLRQCEHDIESTSGIAYRLEHLPSDARDRLETEVDTVDLRVDRRKVRLGSEVFNSYGENMGDGRLLSEWGFIEQDSIGGNVSFTLEELGRGGEMWMKMAEAGLINLTIDRGEGRLIGPQPADRPWTLVIDVDGTISVDLFAIIVVGELANEEGMEEVVQQTVCQVESAAKTLDEEDDHPSTVSFNDSTAKVVEQIIRLVEGRLKALYKADVGLDELFTLQDVRSGTRMQG
jgi:hypothetical protein